MIISEQNKALWIKCEILSNLIEFPLEFVFALHYSNIYCIIGILKLHNSNLTGVFSLKILNSNRCSNSAQEEKNISFEC